MKIKAIIEMTYTKRDTSGNVYHTAKITHPTTGRSFTTHACAECNIRSILSDAFGGRYPGLHITDSCTDSTRLSSLPEHERLDQCSYRAEWKKALNAIGYRRLAAPKA